MALERVGLSGDITKNDACNSLFFEDTTGEYNATTNPLGYGLPGGITDSDVTRVVLVLRYISKGTYITYDFNVLAGNIISVTLSIEGGVPVSISTSTINAWPWVAPNLFEVTGDYGVTIPTVEDGVYQIEYTISGATSGGEGAEGETFSYTTSEQFVLDCNTACCIAKMYAELDPECDCSDAKMKKADEAYSWLQAARYSAEYGDVNEAKLALDKAAKLCDCGCGCN